MFLWASIRRPAKDPLWPALKSLDRPLTLVLGGPGWPERMEAPTSSAVTVRRADDLGQACGLLAEVAGQ